MGGSSGADSVVQASLDLSGGRLCGEDLRRAGPRVCAPRGLLSRRAIRWAIGQLRREGATIQGLARQLGTTWNTLWSQVRPVLIEAANAPSRFEDVQVLGVDEHTLRASPPP